jgi:hypothetical protein
VGLADSLSLVLSLSEQGFVFEPEGRPYTAEEAQAERLDRLGERLLPESWTKVLTTIGYGQIEVESESHEIGLIEFALGGPAPIPEGWLRGRDPAHRKRLEDWVLIGDDLQGDMLCIFAPVGPRAIDGPVAYLSHETMQFDQVWDSFDAFWVTVLEMHDTGSRPQFRPRPVRPSKPHASSPAKPAQVNPKGWTRCPHCNFSFRADDKSAWNGSVHSRCGGPITLS